MAPATIRDVARRANVGVGTVSRVLNDSQAVREETRQRVLAAIAELDYVPNPMARRLSLGQMLTVSVVLPFLTRPSYVERLRGVQEALADTQYDMILFNIENPDQRDHYFRELARRPHADGLIIFSIPPTEQQADLLIRYRVPTVLVDVHHPRFDRVVVDDVKGGYTITCHLIELGHRRIAYLSDHLDNPMNFTSMIDRYRGYRQALEEAGIPIRSEYHQSGQHGREEARTMARTVLALDEPPTAIFAASDTQAIGVMDAAREVGLHIPGDLSVVGYDDIRDADYLNLTTMRQLLFESGQMGVQLLLEELEDSSELAREIKLPIELVIRETTAPPGSP